MSFGLLGFLGVLWVLAMLIELGSMDRTSLATLTMLEIALVVGLILTALTWPRARPALRRVKHDDRRKGRGDKYWS